MAGRLARPLESPGKETVSLRGYSSLTQPSRHHEFHVHIGFPCPPWGDAEMGLHGH